MMQSQSWLLAAALLLSASRLVAAMDREVSDDEYAAAMEQVESGEKVDADSIEVLQRYARQNADEWSGFVNLGRGLQLHTERVEEAFSAFSTAYSLAPHLPAIAGMLGSLAHIHGKRKEAAEVYRTALSVTPRDARMYFQLGLATQDGDEAEDALGAIQGEDASISAWKAAIALDGEMTEAYSHLANRLASKGDRKQAVKYGQTAVALNATDSLTHEALGAALYINKPPAKLSTTERKMATTAFRSALRLREEQYRSALSANKKHKLAGPDKEAVATNHFRLSQVLGTSQALRDDPELASEAARELMEEAMTHMRAAVTLEPKKYKKQAKTIKKWEATKKAEEAKVAKQVERGLPKVPFDPNGDQDPRALERLRKEYPKEFHEGLKKLGTDEAKRLQEEEDAAVEAEEKAEAAAGLQKKARVPKYTPDKVPEPERKLKPGEKRVRKPDSRFNPDGTPKHEEL